jgi:hypothetical protein
MRTMMVPTLIDMMGSYRRSQRKSFG